MRRRERCYSRSKSSCAEGATEHGFGSWRTWRLLRLDEFLDVRNAVESALDATFARDVDFHQQDADWQRLHRLADEGDGSAAFDMTGLHLAVVKPLGSEGGGAAGERYAGRVGSVRLSLASPWLGPSLHAHIVASARLDSPEARAGLSVTGFTLVQATRTPVALHGDPALR